MKADYISKSDFDAFLAEHNALHKRLETNIKDLFTLETLGRSTAPQTAGSMVTDDMMLTLENLQEELMLKENKDDASVTKTSLLARLDQLEA
jgi:hypothetical protein